MKRASLLGTGLAVVMALTLAGSALAAAFTNGGFANTANTFVDYGTTINLGRLVGYDELDAGSTTSPTSATAIPGWTVTSGNVDWNYTYFQAPPGYSYSVDLDGTEEGAISQTFDTTFGATYVVQFWLAGNPDPNSYCDSLPDPSACDSPATKTLTVQATGAPASLYSFDATGFTDQSMGWIAASAYSFLASGSSTTLTFTSTTPGAFGPVIGGVSVTQEAISTGAQCKDGGWKTMTDNNNQPFKNQGDCVSFYAVGGAVPIGN